MELYGLVSFVDDRVFGDASSFKAIWGRPDAASLSTLRDRLKPICRRTLRKEVQAAGHINYTKRISATFKFAPYDNETKLYEALSAYLQRKDTIAFSERNQLLTLVFRKILGSSTFAIAKTLSAKIDTLKAKKRPDIDNFADFDTVRELAEEYSLDEEAAADDEPAIDPIKLTAEIEELEGYLALAKSIKVNSKGEKLLNALATTLDQVVSLGGQRKAVIFTESVRTQAYLAELLSAHGYEGKIALLNGQNNDPESQAIYLVWKRRHQRTDAISDSKTADMKAAIVEAFREDKTILIATESGAEGINLQFCSLVVNYDLPWNPQRVEQRIGRCHRYGQRIDVLVVNFLNLKNRAEERVFDLLRSKFKLFDGVFGASDEILGVIESGTDFEKRILEIHQSARNSEEIDAAFDKLQAEFDERIKAEVLDARIKVMGNFDQDVVRILQDKKNEIQHIMSDFEERLITVAKAELPGAEFAQSAGSPVFTHRGETWTTGWPLADEQNWKFFRLSDDNLAFELVKRAKDRMLPTAKLTFDYRAYNNGMLADVVQHIGRAGWLSVSRLAIEAAERTIEHLLLATVTDDGESLDDATADRFFCLPAVLSPDIGLSPPLDALENLQTVALKRRLDDAEQANADFLTKETEKLDAYSEDLEKAAEMEIKRLDNEIKEKRREMRLRPDLSVAERVEIQRAIKKLEAQRDDEWKDSFERKRKIREDVENVLDRVQANLALKHSVTPVLLIRWELSG